MVITVVDEGGNTVAMHRMDDSLLASISISYSKAYTAGGAPRANRGSRQGYPAGTVLIRAPADPSRQVLYLRRRNPHHEERTLYRRSGRIRRHCGTGHDRGQTRVITGLKQTIRKNRDTGIFRMSPQTVDKAALGFVSQSHFSLIIRIVYKIEFLCGSPSSRSPHFALIFASFLRFMQANVSPGFHFHSGFSIHLCIPESMILLCTCEYSFNGFFSLRI